MDPRTANTRPTSRILDSPSNAALKELRAALRCGELVGGCWVAESPRLLEEALESGLRVHEVYVASERAPEFRERFPAVPSAAWVELRGRAMESLGSIESSQGLIGLVERRIADEAEFFQAQRLTVVLDRIQDPGNAGTILRAAEAFGATGAVFLAGSVSPTSSKILRASAGSLFRIPCLERVDAGMLIAAARVHGISLYAASPRAADALADVAWKWPAALVIGNEGAGVSEELGQVAEGFRIPTRQVESLNAAVSASIALYAISLTREGKSR